MSDTKAVRMFKKYWADLWLRLKISGAVGDGRAIMNELIKRYGEPHRHYHTLGHILEMLQLFPVVRLHCANPEAVELAICFHDAVYNARSKDNEEQSADLAREWLLKYGIRGQAPLVSTLIMATKTRQCNNAMEQTINDLDLWILGAPPNVFHRYDLAIRREYAHVPRSVYCLGRQKLLREFYDRVEIYHLPESRERFGQQARANLKYRLGLK
ncbi:MAG: hypothetical protein AAB467_03715 [Patescibacteria group bacterium]